jgi:hypothetical protein
LTRLFDVMGTVYLRQPVKTFFLKPVCVPRTKEARGAFQPDTNVYLSKQESRHSSLLSPSLLHSQKWRAAIARWSVPTAPSRDNGVNNRESASVKQQRGVLTMMSTLSLSASKGYVARVEATPAAAPAQVDSGTWRGSLSSPGICRSPGCPRRFSFAFTFSYVASCSRRGAQGDC